MAWTSPRTYVVGEIITKSILDTHIKDNLRYLKGLDGAVTLSDALILPDGAGYYLHIPILTTAQRDALTPTAGMLIYNSTTTKFNKYENAGWREDLAYNGDISLLQIASQAAGDILYRGASTWARLGIGTALQILRTNAGATAPEWAALAAATITSGSYTGDSSANKAIAHGLGASPKIVFIVRETGSSGIGEYTYRIISTLARIYCGLGGANTSLSVTVMNATNFYVGHAASYINSANGDGETYYWVALV